MKGVCEMGNAGAKASSYEEWVKMGRPSQGTVKTTEGRYLNSPLQGYYERLDEQAKADKAAAAKMATPSLSDEAIRNAILAERSRALAGNSRKQAFAVRGSSDSYLGGKL